MNLFSGFEVLVIRPAVFVFASVGGVFAADLRSSFIDPAPMVILKVFADRVYQEVPGVVLDKDRGPFMKQKPANKFIFPKGFGLVDR